MSPIYRVTTEGYEGKKPELLLGYARGDPADIGAFYDHMKTRTIRVEELTVVDVTPERLEGQSRLLAERNRALRRLGELNEQLLRYAGAGEPDAAEPAAIGRAVRFA